VWWFVRVRGAELLRICCANWLERRLHRGSHRHDVRSSERGHAVSAVDVGVGPWKGPGRERRAGGSAVAFDEFIKPADDGELQG
jgi:hypothetical protein